MKGSESDRRIYKLNPKLNWGASVTKTKMLSSRTF